MAATQFEVPLCVTRTGVASAGCNRCLRDSLLISASIFPRFPSLFPLTLLLLTSFLRLPLFPVAAVLCSRCFPISSLILASLLSSFPQDELSDRKHGVPFRSSFSNPGQGMGFRAGPDLFWGTPAPLSSPYPFFVFFFILAVVFFTGRG